MVVKFDIKVSYGTRETNAIDDSTAAMHFLQAAAFATWTAIIRCCFLDVLSLQPPPLRLHYDGTKTRRDLATELSRSSSKGVEDDPQSPSSSLSSSLPSDRVLSPEYYCSVYDKITTDDEKNSNDDDRKRQNQQQRRQRSKQQQQRPSPKTPWDIGNYRPQPAVKRAYEEERKIHGHVLDSGCGIGENCIYLASKYNIKSVTGFDLSESAIRIATDHANQIEQENQGDGSNNNGFWKKPHYIVASCTEIANEKYRTELFRAMNNYNFNNKVVDNDNGNDGQQQQHFDIVIDSGLLHCLCDEDARLYVQQISRLLKPGGKFYIGCFSTKNPDPWDNPRRLNPEYVRNLFDNSDSATTSSDGDKNGREWEIDLIRDTWWARPPSRGSSTGGAFSLALWVEVRRT